MPELPEVESVARDLREILVGRTITAVDVHWARTVATHPPEVFAQRLVGQRVQSVGRRGKYLLINLDSGAALAVHLRMTGTFLADTPDEKTIGHCRLLFGLDDGSKLYYCDQRKFGRVYLVQDSATLMDKLGPEPLDDAFTLDSLRAVLRGRKTPIKSVLLDQRHIAGLGNIYADESLFRAQILPTRPASSLTEEEVKALYEAIRVVLGAAIAAGGSTLRDRRYKRPSGELGSFQDNHRVYSRTGQPCVVCGAPIQRVVIGQRSSHFCANCQR